MKKIIILFLCVMLVLVTIPISISADPVNVFEKKDLPFDVRIDIRITNKNNRTIPIHSRMAILPNFLCNYLDILSFSLYEDSEEPDYLFASIEVNKFKFSEYRACYALHWKYNGLSYYVGTNAHSLGEYISPICGYWEECGTIYHNYRIEGDILVDENRITWIIPKELIGNPNPGDVLQDLTASSHLIYQKDCSAPMKLNIASDYAGPLFGDGYTFSIEY